MGNKNLLSSILLLLIAFNVSATTIYQSRTVSPGPHNVLYGFAERYEFELFTQEDQRVQAHPPNKSGWSPGPEDIYNIFGNCEGVSESQLYTYDSSVDQLAGDAFIAAIEGEILCSGGSSGSGGSGDGGGPQEFTYNLKWDGYFTTDKYYLTLLVGQSSTVTSIVEFVNPPGESAATSSWSVSEEGIVKLLDPETGVELITPAERTQTAVQFKGITEGDLLAQAMKDGHVAGVEIKVEELEFVGVIYHGTQALKKDDRTDYGQAIWKDSFPYNGIIDPEAAAEMKTPVWYISNSSPELTPSWAVSIENFANLNIDDVRIRATGPNGITFGFGDDGKGVPVKKEGIDRITSKDPVTADEDLGLFGGRKPVFPKNVVQYFQDFNVTWQVSFDEGSTWPEGVTIGTSSNLLYVSHKIPVEGVEVLHTLLHIGCKYGVAIEDEDATERDDIVSRIFSRGFSILELYQVNPFNGEDLDGGLLYYHKANTQGHAHYRDMFTAPLNQKNGFCGTWSLLFRDVVRSQGIKGLQCKGLLPKLGYFVFGVEPFDAQGNEDPPAGYTDHAVVFDSETDVLYDPSFGKDFDGNSLENALIEWENVILLHFRTAGNTEELHPDDNDVDMQVIEDPKWD
jgi:hypothetical protein